MAVAKIVGVIVVRIRLTFVSHEAVNLVAKKVRDTNVWVSQNVAVNL